jgi:polyphosphate glucokinase
MHAATQDCESAARCDSCCGYRRHERENPGERAQPSAQVLVGFAAAFERPIRIVNDAAMQALGCYEGGRMLFLSLGTALGSTLIAGNVLVPMELGNLHHESGQKLGEAAGAQSLKRLGKTAWRRLVVKAVSNLQGAFAADYVFVGGGNARKLNSLPKGVRKGNNLAAFSGGVRLWQMQDVQTQTIDGKHLTQPAVIGEWKLI